MQAKTKKILNFVALGGAAMAAVGYMTPLHMPLVELAGVVAGSVLTVDKLWGFPLNVEQKSKEQQDKIFKNAAFLGIGAFVAKAVVQHLPFGPVLDYAATIALGAGVGTAAGVKLKQYGLHKPKF